MKQINKNAAMDFTEAMNILNELYDSEQEKDNGDYDWVEDIMELYTNPNEWYQTFNPGNKIKKSPEELHKFISQVQELLPQGVKEHIYGSDGTIGALESIVDAIIAKPQSTPEEVAKVISDRYPAIDNEDEYDTCDYDWLEAFTEENPDWYNDPECEFNKTGKSPEELHDFILQVQELISPKIQEIIGNTNGTIGAVWVMARGLVKNPQSTVQDIAKLVSDYYTDYANGINIHQKYAYLK